MSDSKVKQSAAEPTAFFCTGKGLIVLTKAEIEKLTNDKDVND